jgi:hypothetical protein
VLWFVAFLGRHRELVLCGCIQPLIEIISVALDQRSANWRNLCIIELADSGNGSGMSDRMRVMVRSILTGVIMLVFILPFDHFGLLRSHVVQLSFVACTAAAASFIAGRIVEWMSRRPS